MQTCSVAAVVPLYNGEKFIEECLLSVFDQSEKPDEVIVVDDGSNDDGRGLAIVERIAKSFPVTVLRKENGGQSSARNMAIRHTDCSHIALLDQDDVWLRDHISVLKRRLVRIQNSRRTSEKRPVGVVYGNLDQIDRDGRMIIHGVLDIVPPHPKKSLHDCLGKDMFILPGASLVSKQAVIDVGWFDERLSGYEDDDLFLRMFYKGYDLSYVNESVTKWRIYSNSTSFSPRMAKSRMIYFRKLIEAFPDDHRLEQFWTRDVIGPRFFRHAYSDFISASRAEDKARLDQAWADLNVVIPSLNRKVQKKFMRYSPTIGRFRSGKLSSVSRELLRYVHRSL